MATIQISEEVLSELIFDNTRVHRKTFRKLNVIPVAYDASEEFS